MNRFFLKIIWRSLNKWDIFPTINILGLSIGLAMVLLISMLIFNERSFNRSFKESSNIYRINSKITAITAGETFRSTANATGPAMQEAIPEVISAVRTISDGYDARIGDNSVRINIIWADEDFFRLFDTPFLHGTPEAVMSRPNAVAISEEMGKTLFGNVNPMGETFLLDNYHPMEVAAVYQDYPKNSSFREHKIIAPFTHSYPGWRHEQIFWGNPDYETFCLLAPNADTTHVGAQMRKVLDDATRGILPRSEEGWFFYPVLQKLNEIHLHSAKYIGTSYTSSQSDIEKVKMKTLLLIIILAVACVNYMTLSTARAQKRSKEIGVCKTVGAKRHKLTSRLFFETGVFTFISFIAAYVLAWVALPAFNHILDEQLEIVMAFHPIFMCAALLIWLATTLVAASYPAIYLSSFPPVTAIRNSGFVPQKSHAIVRKILTVGQFAVAVVLIAWVLIIQIQIKYMNNRELGYNPRNLIAFRIFSDSEAIIQEFKVESSVEMIARSSSSLFDGIGYVIFTDANDRIGFPLTTIVTDPDYIDVMQMTLIAGRKLPEQQPGDTIVKIILNRSAVEYLGMTPEEAIGKRVMTYIDSDNYPIVCGVVENFNFESLHRPVSGFAMYNDERKGHIMLRAAEDNLPEQLKTYEEIFKKHYPNENFSPIFIDSYLEKYYDGDRRTVRIAVIFSVLAILVACMGVFGLTAFMAEQRKKEIGIRKVMGASMTDIIRMFTDNYVKLLLISLVIAIPAAWWVGDRYLQDFAYRISLSWWIFAVAALITIALTLLTVGALAIRAAMANPVEAIMKCE